MHCFITATVFLPSIHVGQTVPMSENFANMTDSPPR